MAEIAALPILFPRLRPVGEAFDAQVDWIQATNSPLRGAVFDEVCELIDDAEWARIVETAESDCAGPWAKLVAEIGDGMVAQAALLTGAVAAATEECREVHRAWLGLIGESAEHSEALALVLHARDLWSALEGQELEDALGALSDELDDEEHEAAWNVTIEEVATRLWTEEHDRRLAILVDRAPRRLPVEGFPIASELVLAACDHCRDEEGFGRRVGAELLADTLEPFGTLGFARAA